MSGPGLAERGARVITKIDSKAEPAIRNSRIGSEAIRRKNDFRDRIATEAQRHLSPLMGIRRIAEATKTRSDLQTDAATDLATSTTHVGVDVGKKLSDINAQLASEGKPPLTPVQATLLGDRFTSEGLDKKAHAYVRDMSNTKKMDVINDQIRLMNEGKPTTLDKTWLMKLEKERDEYKLELLIKLLGGLMTAAGATTSQTLNTAGSTVPTGQHQR